MDADSSPCTMTFGDPSTVSPSVRPMPDAVTSVVDGTGHDSSLDTATIAPGYDPPIIAATTSTYVGGVWTGYITPATVGAMSAVGSPICLVVSSSIATIVGCSATPEGALWASASTHPTEGTGITTGSVCPAEDAVALVPLPPKMGMALASSCRLA